MYEVIVSSALGRYTLEIFDSFEPAEEYALNQVDLAGHQSVSIVDTRTGKYVFVLESAA